MKKILPTFNSRAKLSLRECKTGSGKEKTEKNEGKIRGTERGRWRKGLSGMKGKMGKEKQRKEI